MYGMTQVGVFSFREGMPPALRERMLRLNYVLSSQGEDGGEDEEDVESGEEEEQGV